MNCVFCKLYKLCNAEYHSVMWLMVFTFLCQGGEQPAAAGRGKGGGGLQGHIKGQAQQVGHRQVDHHRHHHHHRHHTHHHRLVFNLAKTEKWQLASWVNKDDLIFSFFYQKIYKLSLHASPVSWPTCTRGWCKGTMVRAGLDQGLSLYSSFCR